MTVNVTQEDIENGTYSSLHCPIGLALKRQTGKIWWVSIGCATLFDEMLTDEWPSAYILPDEASIFVSDYDKGLPVAPFSFEMEEKHG